MKNIVLIFTFLILTFQLSFAEDIQKDEVPKKDEWSKEDKLLYLNIATSVGIIGYGYAHWGYNVLEIEPHTKSEGWFESDTKYKGADKIGHAYTGYYAAHMYAHAYKKWGYTEEDAAYYGALSSIGFTSIMELGDSFSPYGISWEDTVSNLIGAAVGYYTYRDKELMKKIDFRMEYKFNKDSYRFDFLTDYEHMNHIFVLKAEGFPIFQRTPLEYLELYLGHGIRGFDEPPYRRERQVFYGLGINLSKILNTNIFNYYQMPNSYLHDSENE